MRSSLCRNTLRAHVLLVEVTPDVDSEHGGEEDGPSTKCTDTTTDVGSVKEDTNGERPHNLGRPIHEIVQGTCPDIEKRSIERGKFYIKLLS